MKLPATAQQVIDNIVDESHEEHQGIPREVSIGIVERLRALEGSGVPWVAAFVDDMLVTAAGRLYAEWRRRHEIAGKTKAGTPINVPAFGGVTRKSEDGTVVHVQLALDGMSLAELREMRDRRVAMRDTLSGEIKVYDALIEVMQERGLATAGEAFAFVFGQAA